jgi:predicted SprT family Zn-dependent metalloprotease
MAVNLNRLARRYIRDYFPKLRRRKTFYLKVVWSRARKFTRPNDAYYADAYLSNSVQGKRFKGQIRLSPITLAGNPKQLRLTLFHELAHLATWGEFPWHGPRWRWEMRRLAAIGAFDSLW